MNARQREATRHPNRLGAGAAKRKGLRGQEKAGVVMHEFKKGTLHSGSGDIVKKRDQAIAIAMHEAGLSRDQKKSTKGSPEFSQSELTLGYRRLGPATDPRARNQKG